ncbi:protein fantom-like isoform X2 [Orbicella faveolata]|uniref:protein fantom-like isoform X2 n=1 Tax=Orbicella faveolata TaxID=48498 RepID=UPI0009E4BD6F|nr:protein fantom-like isoform X2 [Orbicella faveolata]
MVNLVWKLFHTVWTDVITPLQIKTCFSQFFSVFAVKDVDTKEKIADLESKIVELEKQNAGLKNKLTVAKQQLQTQGKRATPYDHVKPRVHTGIHARTPSGNRLKKDLRVQGHDIKPGSSRVPPPMLPQPRYGHSLLEEARLEKRELEELISQLQDQIQLLDEDGAQLREQLRQNQLHYEDEIMRLKEQLSDAKRSNIQENVDLIKLQREIKEKATKFEALQVKYLNLEENLAKVKASHTQVLEDMEKLNEELKQEQTKNFVLKNDLKSGGIASKSLSEQLQMIGDLKAENAILKEANENLVNSAFDAERERQHRAKYRQMEVEMEQLRATLHSDLQEKNDILDKLTSERESAEKLQTELRELRVQHYTLKEQHDDLKEKMKFFTKESAVDFQEIEEALVLIKHRKEKGSQDLDFLEKVDDEMNKDLKRQVQELQASHADTINELEKTRNMLIIQHKINKDYQTEVERVTKKMSEDKKEYDLKMQEYAQLLDIRADRIRKLESQMRDVAYGTKQYKTAPSEESEFEEMDSTVELERGQNIFEIHIDKVIFSQESVKEFEDDEPVTFVTYEFFEHELQTTPVVKGTRPEFNFTSQYLVRVDDFFLHYLQKESTLIEIHRAFGTDYRTVAACQLKFRDLLEKPHGRVHSTAKFIGSRPPCQGVEFATMEYWVRLRVPMDQAIRLYREHTKALGYMNSGAYKALEDAGHVPEKPPSDVNELDVHIIRCSGVKPRRQGIQPSPYAVYRFFDFADHDTDIVQSTNTPEFNDIKTFPVPMTPELDTYLRAAALEIYVFDDADPEPAVYLGLAKVPLITLANDKTIKGTFELRRASGGVNGTIDVYLKWRYTYLPASAKPRAAPQRVMQVPDERESFNSDSEPEVKSAVKSSNTRDKPPSPVDSSTPKQEQREEKIARRESAHLAQIKRKPSDLLEKVEPDERKKEKPLESMSVDELIKATAKKPQPAPRTRKLEPEKPVEEMSIDEMFKAAEEPAEEPGGEVKSTREIVETETSEDEQDDEALVAEEMRRTTEAEGSEDTMFEEPASDLDSTLGEEVDIPLPSAESKEEVDDEEEPAEEVEEEIDEEEEEEEEENKREEEKGDGPGESGAETSESEAVMVSPRHSRAKSAVQVASTVVIQVTSLTLHPEASILDDPNVKQVFVAYKFLDCDPADLETPISLPKPAPYRPISFNFKKVFHVDAENNQVKRNYLIYMLSNDPKLVFTVVSDPPEDEGDCVDVAYASVDFVQILNEREDFIDKDIELYDIESNSEIGTLTVTVEALQALLGLYNDE